jgi:hypothetical protein
VAYSVEGQLRVRVVAGAIEKQVLRFAQNDKLFPRIVVWTADLQRERSLPWCWRHLVDGEALVDGFGAAEAVQARTGQDERVGLAFAPLAQAGVDVATHLDKAYVGAESEDHGLAAGAGRPDGRAGGQHVQAPVILADEGVAGVRAWRDGGQREARVDLRRQVFQGMDGEVDAASR